MASLNLYAAPKNQGPDNSKDFDILRNIMVPDYVNIWFTVIVIFSTLLTLLMFIMLRMKKETSQHHAHLYRNC